MIVVAKWKLLSASAFCFLRRSQALISLLAIYGIGGNQRALAETTLGSLLQRCTSPDVGPRAKLAILRHTSRHKTCAHHDGMCKIVEASSYGANCTGLIRLEKNKKTRHVSCTGI